MKVLLIGGTSHTGKSTLCRRLAEDIGWNSLSTDQLSRHPGRPWRDVGEDEHLPADVVDHYSNLPTEALTTSVLTHYQENVWPIVRAIVRTRLNNPFDLGLVLEGSAILPELANLIVGEEVHSVWLAAPEPQLRERVHASAAYPQRNAGTRKLIDAFLERTIAFQKHLERTVHPPGQTMLRAYENQTYEQLKALLKAAN